jgi:hypothetical protein
MKGVKLPLLSIGRATGAAAQFWYDNPAKTPTTRQHITVRAVEELIGAPPGALTRRLRNPPKLRRGPRAQ